MKSLLSKVFFSLLVFGCSVDIPNDSAFNIDLSKSEKIKASSFIESIKYVLVNYSDSLPIVQPYRMEIHKGKIYIEDNSLNNLFVVNNLGEVDFVIKSTGEGPGQFKYIDDFQVGENEIIIKDTQLNKFIFFNHHGEFIREQYAKNKALNFYYGSNFILHFFNNRLDPGKFNFVRESLENGKIKNYYLVRSGYEYKVLSLENSFSYNSFTKKIFLTIPYSYDIAFFDISGNLENIRTFDFGVNSLDDENRLGYKNGRFISRPEVEGENYVEMINQFFSFTQSNYMFVTNGLKEKHMIIFDRDFNIVKQANKIVNDIDGMPIGNFPRWQSDSQLVQKRLSTYFLNDYLNNQKDILEKFPDSKIHDFVKNHREKLEKDWLVLVFWQLKKP